MPLQATSGAASYDGFGGGVAAVPNYIEDVFSTYLYTGTSPTDQTINNGIDLAGKGGMVWFKGRNTANGSSAQVVVDTVRGRSSTIKTYTSNGEAISPTGYDLVSFNSNGFTVGEPYQVSLNNSGLPTNYASWTFRKQPKFFTQGTYSGNGSTQAITHDLGSAPGCVIVKNLTTAGSWIVWHSGLTSGYYIQLNGTGPEDNTNAARRFGNNSITVNPTSTTITVGDLINTSGDTWVYYAFASNAGGFGLTGTDNVISCGSFTTDGSGNATVNLGYEPQLVMYKRADGAGSWAMFDNMRGMTVNTTNGDAILFANLSDAESTVDWIQPTATGFNPYNIAWNATYIYIAIRRGPMKVPTDGTKVFAPVTYMGDGSTTSGQLVPAGFPVDMGINRYKTGGAGDWDIVDRLRGLSSIGTSPNSRYLNPHNTNAEAGGGYIFDATNTSVDMYGFASPNVQLNYLFRRAPGFFDEVCYTGTSSAQNISHNLTVAPEFVICKSRNVSANWQTQIAPLGPTYGLPLSLANAAFASTAYWNDTAPTASVFTVGTSTLTNGSGQTYVAYLFASCPGVSKVGTYTGTATTQQINCGFTAGARFVLIKRTDSTGDWYVWDSARGIVAGNDPYLLLNSTAAEVTSTDYVDTYSAGFEISSTAPAAINASGGSFIFLAIA